MLVMRERASDASSPAKVGDMRSHGYSDKELKQIEREQEEVAKRLPVTMAMIEVLHEYVDMFRRTNDPRLKAAELELDKIASMPGSFFVYGTLPYDLTEHEAQCALARAGLINYGGLNV